MFIHWNRHSTGRPIFAVGYILLMLTFLWAFLTTVDGPVVNFSSNAGSIGYSQTPRLLGWKHGGHPEATLTSALQNEAPAFHAFFLLFDFKQTLRLRPIRFNALSRSPPFSAF